MNSSDLLHQWSGMTLAEIDEQLSKGENHEAVQQFYGKEKAEILQNIASVATKAVDGEPVVLLPGIMGSNLNSVMGVAKQLWIDFKIMLEGNIRYLELDQAGEYDRVPKLELIATGLETAVYKPISLALYKHANLYEFPYDWRRSIPVLAEKLHYAIEKWAQHQPKKFTLVGHSMGGLVARAYVLRNPDLARHRIQKIITMGTPFYGATSAIDNLVRGNRQIKIAEYLNKNNDVMRLLRNLPSLYQLIPVPAKHFPNTENPPANWDWFNAKSWRISAIRDDYLKKANVYYDDVLSQQSPVEINQIVGCHIDTPVAVERQMDEREHPTFPPPILGNGDGTVPLWSAKLPEATCYYIQEEHGYLPVNPKVIDAVLTLIDNKTPDLPTALPIMAPWDRLWDSANEAANRIRNAVNIGNITLRELTELYFGL